MRFGFFDQLPRADWQSESQRYQDILAQIELGDELGFDTAWLGELHFIPSFSCLASPLMILAAAAQRTKRIRLGTAVTLLPLHNPVKMAEDAATLDVLSNGRLEFGVGRGATPVYFAGYNVPQEESRERFEESLEVILQAWTSERLSYEGKYFRVQDVRLTPQPVQKPYPPIRIAANSPDTFAIAGQLGLPIFASPLINPPDKLREYLNVHRTTLKSGAKQDVALAFPVHVADSRAQARIECEASLMHFFSMAGELVKPLATIPSEVTRPINSYRNGSCTSPMRGLIETSESSATRTTASRGSTLSAGNSPWRNSLRTLTRADSSTTQPSGARWHCLLGR
jgi:alkanesulfonate monooxygenase SsuD/methylene tetrahydromethanopterin reductase-like flavin-dependent oxidoreductase (luciferase family)